MSPSSGAQAETERKIGGLALGRSPGPNMSAGVGKRSRKSGCLHVVLEATESLSCGEQNTCLECQGLYSACLGLAGSAFALPEPVWMVPWLRTTEGSGLFPWVEI